MVVPKATFEIEIGPPKTDRIVINPYSNPPIILTSN